MKRFYNKWFQKWLNKTKLTTSSLNEAIKNMEEGKSANSLGSNLYKVRVATSQSGKSGGYRTLLVLKKDVRVIFVSAFAKSEKDNLTKLELKDLKELSKTITSMNETDFQALVNAKAMIEFEEENNE